MIYNIPEQLRLFDNKRLLGLLAAILTNVFSSFGMTPPSCPTIMMSGNSLACYGDQNGTATVSIITQSSGNYTYTWSNGNINSGSSSTISNLSVGTYTVTVKDNISGCTVVGAFVVNSPAPITINENISNVACFGQAIGSIDIDVFGGSGPYQYLWSNGVQSQDLTNVAAGSYSVTVEAPNANCIASKSFIINEPLEALDHSGLGSEVSCFGESSGSIALTVWGGTPPYSFDWNSGSSTEDLVNIPAGNYNVSISDYNNCTSSSSYEINQPPLLNGEMSANNVACFGDGSGSVSIAIVGGESPFDYSWYNTTTLFAQNQPSMFNLSAEVYNVVVTDNNGCIYTDNIEIIEPTELNGNITTISDVDCFGGSDGELDLTPIGGSPPYTLSWINSQGAPYGSDEDLNDIPASVYTVAITDYNLCAYEIEHEIFQPSTAIFVESQITNVKCFGENTGAIDLNIQGGTSPFQISWSNGQETNAISNLTADNYTYTVIDYNLCTFSNAVTVDEPEQGLSVNEDIVHVLCHGESTGSIGLSVSGGTTPYNYSWSNTTYQLSVVSSSINNFPSTDYIYEVTDFEGCKYSDTITIDEPESIIANFSTSHVLCKGDSSGIISSDISGGMTPYTFNWSNGSLNADLSSLAQGIYQLDLSDYNGCFSIYEVTIEEPIEMLASSISVGPVSCHGGQDGSIVVLIEGGTAPYHYNWSSQDTVFTIEDITAGNYELITTDTNMCSIIDSISVPQPEPINLNELIQEPTCFGFSNGSIQIEPEGGTQPYTYTWFDSGFTLASQEEDLINIDTDTYQLQIIDSNLCLNKIFIEIGQPDSLWLEYELTSLPCYGDSTGTIQLFVSGGTPNYNVLWSNNTNAQGLENVPSGPYSVEVIDSNQCVDSLSLLIPFVDPIEIAFDMTSISCIDQSDGAAIANVTGGYEGYVYDWYDGSNFNYHENLNNRWYTLSVTDVLNCNGVDSVYIESSSISCVQPVNTFTPNGDNYNDTWIIDNLELYPDLEMKIYNKWGVLINDQSKNYIPWEGNHKNNPLPSDSYYYIINLNKPNREILNGVITIIR